MWDVPVEKCVSGDCWMYQWRGTGVGCASGEVWEGMGVGCASGEVWEGVG